MSSEKISTRERILKSTCALLENAGGETVRMSDIAKAAKVSRQAVYLHFPTRAELLIAATVYLDEVNQIEDKLVTSRAAKTGASRLEHWIDAWGNHIPAVYGVAKALMAMQDTDSEARAAWRGRMDAVRDGCAAAIQALEADNNLTDRLSSQEATDMLWALVSVRSWELLCLECGWSQEQYLAHMKDSAHKILVAQAMEPRPESV